MIRIFINRTTLSIFATLHFTRKGESRLQVQIFFYLRLL
ncbi:hypothetical protein AB434_2963 [Heyndrickxia coagulans]|uniref:Uncharacterized protein n=1 Tax=Heyndrickxia coagulans TaxID=1398 RepID=A0AAN0WCJ5_HEYCO|nr:hypothetical protein SB48_HM08orf03689 [Heyndrickxia coagulans]AKN55368.1 hypothetical protein AB434_2963 [Heyndrickxia coagulans]